MIKAKVAARPDTITAAANSGSGILLYNPTDGSATYGTVYADGHFLTTAYYPPGSFAINWTHIVRANGLLFFYRWTDGFWATVRTDPDGSVATLRLGYISNYYQHVVSTPNGILFCKYYGGTGTVGQVAADGSFRVTYSAYFDAWDDIVNTPNGLVFHIISGGYLSSIGRLSAGRIQPNGTFIWTGDDPNFFGARTPRSIVAAGNNLLIFDRYSGRYMVEAINSSGGLVIRNSECSPQLPLLWGSPVAIGNDLFLKSYDESTQAPQGWTAVATFRGSSYFTNPSCWGKLRIKQEHLEGSLTEPWEHIVNTANGTFFYKQFDGSAMVGKFDASGNFSQTHYLESWLDPSYGIIISVTD